MGRAKFLLQRGHGGVQIDIDDGAGLLEGDYKDRRMAYFSDMKDAKAKEAALTKVVNDWVAFRDKKS